MNRETLPAHTASTTWRGGPCHSNPETTTFVSSTRRIAHSPFRAGRLDLDQHFRIGQRRFGQSRQAVGGVEQFAHPAASNLVAQHGRSKASDFNRPLASASRATCSGKVTVSSTVIVVSLKEAKEKRQKRTQLFDL